MTKRRAAARWYGHRGTRVLLVPLTSLAFASCFLPLPRVMKPPEPLPDPEPAQVDADSARAEVGEVEEREPPVDTPSRQPETVEPPPETADETPVTPAIEAIIDSIEVSVRDSIAAAPRRDSIAAVARRDSIALADRVARRDSIIALQRAAAAWRDSIRRAGRAAARQDSIDSAQRAAARQDSLEVHRDSLARTEAARSEAGAELERLRASGPAYVAYEEGARLVWDTDAEAALATTLLPVIRAEGLDADIGTTVWLLVRADGRVDTTVIQTSSDNAAFDAAAVRAARALIFAPALRDGRAVPVWVLREISLLMR